MASKPIRIPKPAPVKPFVGWPSLKAAKLQWRDEVPESERYGDIYFSRDNGLEETRHVFLQGIKAPEIWQDKAHFAIGETGFGTGLNFLACWDLWRRTAPAGSRLTFASVEAWPVRLTDLCRAHAAFPDLAPLAKALQEAYPTLIPGFHRLRLDKGRVTLLLLLGEAKDVLQTVEGSFDAWFLDGFAPAQNEDLWSDAVFAEIARLSHPETHLASFTVAAKVRKGLEDHGFLVTKRPGYGRKRHCLQAQFQGWKSPSYRRPPKASFMSPEDALPLGSAIAIIGAGIAGASAAFALRDAGYRPVLFDRHPHPGAEGSGNQSALMDPRTDVEPNPIGSLHIAAFEDACRFVKQLEDETGQPIWHPPRGVLRLSLDAVESEKLHKTGHAGPWSGPETDHLVQRLTLADIEQKIGTALPSCAGYEGLWLAHGGCLHPESYLKALLQDIEQHYNHPVTQIIPLETGWRLQFSDAPQRDFDALVLANGYEVRSLLPDLKLPLRPQRGQATRLEETEDSCFPACTLSFGSYLTAAYKHPPSALQTPSRRILGATHSPWPLDPDTEALEPGWDHASSQDDDHNFSQLAALSPAFMAHARKAHSASRASLRAALPDQTPALGAVAVPEEVHAWLKPHYTRRDRTPQYLPRLAVFCGLGSRGFQTSSLLAALLAAQWSGTPWPVSRDLAEHCSAIRFAMRAFRKGS